MSRHLVHRLLPGGVIACGCVDEPFVLLADDDRVTCAACQGSRMPAGATEATAALRRVRREGRT